MTRRNLLVVTGGAVGVMLLSPSALSALYEGFAYAPGSLVSGSSGGTGFSGPWFETGGGSVRVGAGLVYSNGSSLATTPGAAVADPVRVNALLNRQYAPGLPASGEVWLSFLVNLQVANTSYALLALQAGNGGAGQMYAFSVARPTPGASYVQAAIAPYTGGGSGGIFAPAQLQFGQTAFIVGRIMINGTGAFDVASLWVNPRLDVPLGTPDATLANVNVVGGASIGAVKVELGSLAANVIDEIRVGSAADDVIVIPAPPQLVWAAMIGVTTLARARRRAVH